MIDKNKRSYRQFCGLAKALDVVGERWTLPLIRNLLLGPQRYTDLLRGLPGITTNLLADRLKHLESAGLLERIRLSPGQGAEAYRLTERGSALEPAIHALGSWGWDYMQDGPGPDEHARFDWFLIALRRRYLGGQHLSVEFLIDDAPYAMRLGKHAIETQRGGVSRPDLRIRGTGPDVVQWFMTGLPERVVVAGSSTAAAMLRQSFRSGEAA